MKFRLRSICRVRSLLNDRTGGNMAHRKRNNKEGEERCDDSCGFYGSRIDRKTRPLTTFANLFQRDAIFDDIHRMEIIARCFDIDEFIDDWHCVNHLNPKSQFFKMMATTPEIQLKTLKYTPDSASRILDEMQNMG